MKTIAFQGEKGAYSEEAAYGYWGQDVRPVPRDTFKRVFESATDGSCEFGIVPIENSLTGSIYPNFDLLLEFDLSIVGEIVIPIRHHLMARRGVRLHDIRKVYSHPQAIDQCAKFLESMSGVAPVVMHDTAGAARFVAEEGLVDGAAIASLRASQNYGLHILKRNVEDFHNNYTRFLVISRHTQKPGRNAKTSIVFSMKDIPGALFKAIAVFALRDINLLKIESRPLRKGPWKYRFYLDFEGSVEEERSRNALQNLREITDFMKILGSFSSRRVVA